VFEIKIQIMQLLFDQTDINIGFNATNKLCIDFARLRSVSLGFNLSLFGKKKKGGSRRR
jgi:hypothetical protein